jgi:hypothetical protein
MLVAGLADSDCRRGKEVWWSVADFGQPHKTKDAKITRQPKRDSPIFVDTKIGTVPELGDIFTIELLIA